VGMGGKPIIEITQRLDALLYSTALNKKKKN
jgi:hypothetical protein